MPESIEEFWRIQSKRKGGVDHPYPRPLYRLYLLYLLYPAVFSQRNCHEGHVTWQRKQL